MKQASLALFLKTHRGLFILLALAWLLRVALCSRGGELFFPDENRYSEAYRVLYNLARGDWAGALDKILVIRAHVGFTLGALIPAAIHALLVLTLGRPAVWPSFQETMWLAAAQTSLASVACIGLCYALALKLGAKRKEALIAAALMACSNSMFYYSRHLLPYDSSLALGLLALWLMLEEPPGWKRSLFVGAAVALCLFTYLGYCFLALTIGAFYMIYRAQSVFEILKRGAFLGAIGASLPAVMSLATWVRGSHLYALSVQTFFEEDTLVVHQGDLAEGWTLPWTYLWHAEHGLLLVILLGAAATLCLALSRKKFNRGMLWLSLAAALYGALAMTSSSLGLFPINARLSRQILPFLVLASAYGLSALAELLSTRLPRPKALAGMLAAAIIGQTAYNFARPFQLTFPWDFRRQIPAQYGRVSHALTVKADAYDPPDDKSTPYVLVNAQYLFPVLCAIQYPSGKVLMRAPHPLEFLPYQYDGHKPSARAILRSQDISMRLIERAAAKPQPDGQSQ
ncbi:MAG TPA: hypothetical protein DEB40_06725 [Elusimicrobia bacterium]|nr:hypothetical protein [Elusimicrobiota bacterium]HBT61421.1 hypothetical protein [Elusimicrobiota bacterium]